MAYALASTSFSHSGYAVFGATDHDRHHEHFDCNFGVGVFMDSLFGTQFEGSRLEARVAARKREAVSKRGL